MQGVLRTQKVKNTAREKGLTMGTQTGSVKVLFASTVYYKAFPTAFAAAPAVMLTSLGSPVTTTPILHMRQHHLTAGSFKVFGSPVNTYAGFNAYGSLTV